MKFRAINSTRSISADILSEKLNKINTTINDKSNEQAKALSDLNVSINLEIKQNKLSSAEELNASLL
jgi:hypothetical protein